MTTALRDATGRFITRPPLPECQSCGRVLFENLAADLMCVWPRCASARQVVGNTGADVGVLGILRNALSASVSAPDGQVCVLGPCEAPEATQGEVEMTA